MTEEKTQPLEKVVSKPKWTDDITNVRTWEIRRELNYQGFSDEDINNFPLEVWFVAGVVQKIIREHKQEWVLE